jgi:hypothetical protein
VVSTTVFQLRGFWGQDDLEPDRITLYVAVFTAAVLLDVSLILVVRCLKARKERPAIAPKKRPRLAAWFGERHWLPPIIEIVALALLASWLGRAYLNFDPDVVPGGNPYSPSRNEYGSLVQTHHVWTWAQQCGICALWNGSEYGGYPSFVDVHGSALHPLVIVTTLIWGVVNGSKAALIVAFWAGGVAQWWLARVMKLGWLARLWSGAMGVVGGHLASRMELGAFGMVLSTAMCSLVFAPALAVARSGRRRDAILLALMLASAAVAGQGYMQIGLLFAAPAFLFLVLGRGWRLLPVWREYAIAIGLALLLAAPFLVPLAHFFPNFTKNICPDFSSAQPLEYLPLNLVIRDPVFFTNEVLSKPNYPHRTALYIGWVSVALAALCLKFARREDRRALLYLGTSALLVLLTGSGVLLSWVRPVVSGILGVRHPTMIAGLAVPPILGLAAYGLDRLWGINWPRLRSEMGWGGKWLEFIYTPKWLLLISLIWNLVLAYNFSSTWLHVMRLPAEVDAVLQALHTPGLQWVEPPFGEHHYVEPAIRKGYKLNRGFMAWFWRDRPAPDAYLVADRKGVPPNAVEVGEALGVPIYRFTDFREYAFVQSGYSVTPCDAFGAGGDLLVKCSTNKPGTLVVRENSWSGWYAWRDQRSVLLLDDRWLQVDAPAGEHQYRFRYLPWDVPLGILLCLLGVALTVWQWIKYPPSRVVPEEGVIE